MLLLRLLKIVDYHCVRRYEGTVGDFSTFISSPFSRQSSSDIIELIPCYTALEDRGNCAADYKLFGASKHTVNGKKFDMTSLLFANRTETEAVVSRMCRYEYVVWSLATRYSSETVTEQQE